VPGGVYVAEEGTIMLSPIRQRAMARELKQLLDRLPELGKSQSSNSSPRQTWSPGGVITPPYVPVTIPPIPSVPAVRVELIPTTRLSLINTKDTGDIDMTITQDDKQTDEQVEEDDEGEEEQPSDQETLEQIKKHLRDELVPFQRQNQKNPRRIRLSAHDLIPLARNRLIDTVLYLHGTNIIVEPDPEIGDDIQCDA
jgi:hypothetical protein